MNNKGTLRSITSPHGPKSRGVPPPMCGFHLPAIAGQWNRSPSSVTRLIPAESVWSASRIVSANVCRMVRGESASARANELSERFSRSKSGGRVGLWFNTSVQRTDASATKGVGVPIIKTSLSASLGFRPSQVSTVPGVRLAVAGWPGTPTTTDRGCRWSGRGSPASARRSPGPWK